MCFDCLHIFPQQRYKHLCHHKAVQDWRECSAGDAAQALGPAIMTVFIVFGGYYANASNVPKGLRWIAHTSLIKYSFEAFCVNEFHGLTFVNDKPGRAGSESGEEVGTRKHVGVQSVHAAIAMHALLGQMQLYIAVSILLLSHAWCYTNHNKPVPRSKLHTDNVRHIALIVTPPVLI